MKIHFVLVSPHTPENLGAACRAIKTMGFLSLRVVEPRCDIYCDKAYQLAHGSYDILESIVVYKSIGEALSDCQLAIACTAKCRDSHADYFDLNSLPALIDSKREGIADLAIVFGREDGGLSNEELACCHITSSIPMATEYPSLNLAQAVMLYANALSPMTNLTKCECPHELLPFEPLRQKLLTALERLEIWPSSAIHGRITERIAAMSASDMRLAHSFLSRVISQTGKRQ